MSAEDGFAAIVNALADRPGVTSPAAPSASPRSFGSSALRVDGRIFAMVSRGRLVLKLPRQRVAELIGSGAGKSYDAGKGRPMKEWLSLDPEQQDSWLDLATEALRFVGSRSQSGLHGLTQAMAARVARGELPGLVILVAHGDDVHVETIGAMAFGSDDPIRRDTIFRIASMTKPILAVATLMLVDDGKLALNEPVTRLLPELANPKVLRRIDGPLDDTVPANRPITVDDLLTFRMGYGMLFEPSFEPPYPIVNAANELQLVMGPPDPRTPHDPDEWIKRFGRLPLMYQPGERWQYNAGSLVLSVLVARASGQPLEDFFRTRIFEPLGMSETGFSVPTQHAGRLPGYYMTNFQTGMMELQTLSPPSQWTKPPAFPSGAGGLLSTADDYLAFARLLLNKGVHKGERLLSRKAIELVTTNHLTPEQMAMGGPPLAGRGWGFGVAVVTQPAEVAPVPGRYGWDGGYGTSWFNDPKGNLVAIALTQTADFLFNGGSAEFERLAVT